MFDSKNIDIKEIRIGKNLKVSAISPKDGERLDFSKKLAPCYRGPKEFDYVAFDFLDIFSKSVNSLVPEGKRLRKNKKDLKIVSLLSDEVLEKLEDLVETVNYSSRQVISSTRKSQYRKAIKVICKNIDLNRDKTFNESIIVPLRGGALFLKFLDVSRSKIFAIDCKRLPVRNKHGRFYLGMRRKYNLPRNFKNYYKDSDINGKVIRIVEVCIASGMTTVAVMLDFFRRGLRPEKIEVNAAAMSQQGIEFIKGVADFLQLNIIFITGGLFYRLGDFYKSGKDEILTLDEKLVVGDAIMFLR